MIASFLHKLRRLATDQSGNATVEFVIWFPVYLFLLVAGLEMGSASWRNAALETALDRTTRELRLPSSAPMQHAEIKAAICDKTVLISNCSENLQLEMVVLDPNNWVDPAAPTCTDTIAPVAPLPATQQLWPSHDRWQRRLGVRDRNISLCASTVR